ncbi:MAG: N-acetyl-gamma-glutamyl-phosphate reductase [Actinomycetaceae bacterium]|nr:N-acetyl-gamma-glutamyl-phosphate reductase [Actinomycetaceae bacterium]
MVKKVSVVGATGYAGGEALRLIAHHSELELFLTTAGTSRGLLKTFHPHISEYANREVTETDTHALAHSDVVVVALPHGASAKVTSEIVEENPDCLIVDLGADHRLESPDDWRQYYGSEPSQPWCYGMPELVRASGESQREKLSKATYIAAPGCNASAVTFAAQPAVHGGIVDDASIVATLAVGYSGAGKSLKPHLLASEALGGALPYAVGGTHRHIPEIAQNLRHAGGQTRSLVFTPVLVPMSRGILASVTMRLKDSITQEELDDIYADTYGKENFIHHVPYAPSTSHVVGSNNCYVYPKLDEDREHITVISVIDNLMKGTAGAAIQSLNLALGYEETYSLERNGVAP